MMNALLEGLQTTKNEDQSVVKQVGELEKHLLEELRRTGYPLEIEISSMLEGKGYLVNNCEYFFDSDMNKAREVDISAYPPIPMNPQPDIRPFVVGHHLVVECKKSETHAWIFLTRHEKSVPFSGQCIDFLNYAQMDLQVSFLNTIRATCNKCLHYDSFDRVARTHVELKYQRKQDGKDEILEAKNQLVKFIAYDIGNYQKRLGGVLNPFRIHYIEFYHPTIVFDGKLYEAIVKDGSIELLEKNHLLLATTYSPAYVSDFKASLPLDLPYLIDVVRKDYFSDFLRILDNEYSALRGQISENLETLRSRARMNLKPFSSKSTRWKKITRSPLYYIP